jgi:hypothetical protein
VVTLRSSIQIANDGLAIAAYWQVSEKLRSHPHLSEFVARCRLSHSVPNVLAAMRCMLIDCVIPKLCRVRSSRDNQEGFGCIPSCILVAEGARPVSLPCTSLIRFWRFLRVLRKVASGNVMSSLNPSRPNHKSIFGECQESGFGDGEESQLVTELA